jgi:hypothetical protein
MQDRSRRAGSPDRSRDAEQAFEAKRLFALKWGILNKQSFRADPKQQVVWTTPSVILINLMINVNSLCKQFGCLRLH